MPRHEFCPRVRNSLDGLRHDLARTPGTCVLGGSLDTVNVALAQTIRHYERAGRDSSVYVEAFRATTSAITKAAV